METHSTLPRRDSYREAWRRRRELEAARQERAREEAWRTARRAAELLRGEYGASRVLVFGSLARGTFRAGASDLDLAVEGLPDSLYLRALGHLLDVFGERIDLVRLEDAPAALREDIRRDGKEPA